MYGIFNRKSMAITNLPIAFASATAAAMIPEISALFAKKDTENTSTTVSKVTKVILLIAIPSAAGLLFLSKPIIMILFPQKSSLDEAALLLRCLSVTVVFYSLSTVSNAVLQGIGKVNVPVFNALIALVIQTLVLSVLLLNTPLTDVSLCVATIVYSLLMCILNSLSLKKYIVISNDIKKTYVLPIISSLVMGVASWGTYQLISFVFYIIKKNSFASTVEETVTFNEYLFSNYFVNLSATFISIIVAVVVYFVVLIASGGASEDELKRLPKGYKAVGLFKKLKLLR